MNFYFQDPTIPYSYSLHEALLQACTGAQKGGGAYAFVTQDGVKLLLEDNVFRSFVENGSFKLVVGIDEITNEYAIERLKTLKDSYKGLEIIAFLHNVTGSLFHPKFTWFKNHQGGVLIVGSGNLTASGLRSNWEAFSLVQVDRKKINEIERDWNKWLDHSKNCLRPLDDKEVIEKTKNNLRWNRKGGKKQLQLKQKLAMIGGKSGIQVSEDVNAWSFTQNNIVFISEIPRSGNRWNQANFDKKTFSQFFGATPGDNSQRILLRNVTKEGLLSDIEIRPSVSVKSQNYRFELEAAAGMDYPKEGRPIGIFIRVSTRMFLYYLAMPDDKVYGPLQHFLYQNYKGRNDRMKRFLSNVQALQKECNSLPLFQTFSNLLE